ncbi:CLUMA_CG008018, isoform A [Clunio marinus]|uniref:CLUMA_CG008018, isoform A n=1 Tax=Clunio marinus TaxID=568069 RepID=A0A1J1I7Y5_9DIPT|nr:CLUMA_CG008018, isoform A [Clunio marinus]
MEPIKKCLLIRNVSNNFHSQFDSTSLTLKFRIDFYRVVVLLLNKDSKFSVNNHAEDKYHQGICFLKSCVSDACQKHSRKDEN